MPGCAVAPNMFGHPPGMTLTPCSRQRAIALSDMLPGPRPRCSQMPGTPTLTRSSTTCSATSGVVTTRTAGDAAGIAVTAEYDHQGIAEDLEHRAVVGHQRREQLTDAALLRERGDTLDQDGAESSPVHVVGDLGRDFAASGLGFDARCMADQLAL